MHWLGLAWKRHKQYAGQEQKHVNAKKKNPVLKHGRKLLHGKGDLWGKALQTISLEGKPQRKRQVDSQMVR